MTTDALRGKVGQGQVVSPGSSVLLPGLWEGLLQSLACDSRYWPAQRRRSRGRNHRPVQWKTLASCLMPACVHPQLLFHTQIHTGTFKLETQQDVKALESNRSTWRYPSTVPFPAFIFKAFIRHFDNWTGGPGLYRNTTVFRSRI